MNVQDWVADEGDAKEVHEIYESLMCLACRGRHLVNRRTGQVLNEPKDE